MLKKIFSCMIKIKFNFIIVIIFKQVKVTIVASFHKRGLIIEESIIYFKCSLAMRTIKRVGNSKIAQQNKTTSLCNLSLLNMLLLASKFLCKSVETQLIFTMNSHTIL